MFHRSGGADPGRDGCRVPLPWSGQEPPFGFSQNGASASPWLPQPPAWNAFTAEAQEGRPDSMLWLYREALRVRRAEPALCEGSLSWLEAGDGVLAFARGDDFACVVNLSDTAVELPEHESVLLHSGTLENGLLPPDTAAWLRVFRP